MKYDLKEINFRTVQDPKGFVKSARRDISRKSKELLRRWLKI